MLNVLLPALTLTLTQAAPSSLAAADISRLSERPDIPAALRPWIGWVLRGSEGQLCPAFPTGEEATEDEGSGQAPRCLWPSTLELTLDGAGGRFTLKGRAFARQFVAIPGDADHWPTDVKAGGTAAKVLERSGSPSVELPPGEFTIAGAFHWSQPPSALAVPDEVALVSLAVEGRAVAAPARAGGKLLLESPATAVEEDRAELRVARKVMDSAPLQLVTHLDLNVSGRARELVLGRVLPPGFIPVSLESGLTARLRQDGHLDVQARPGAWAVDITARHEGAANELSRPDPEGPWTDSDEIWAFEAQPALRLVTVDGVTPVDPQQARMPEDWKTLPSFAVRPGEVMKLVQKRRGDEEPAPDQLQLVRNLWLDFDGRGLSVQDSIQGTLGTSWRLEMPAPFQLGHVNVGGRDQLITRLTPDGAPGVEVRQAALSLTADSRLEGPVGDLSAVAWSHDFTSVSGTLHLPPGWRLFHLWGVDEAPDTWVRHWTLLDLFLLLVLAFGIGRLWGRGAGVLAAAALALTFPEPDAPKLIWLGVVVCEALARALPGGRFRRVMRVGRLVAYGVLALIAIPFVVEHLRTSMYPALEQRYRSEGELDLLALSPQREAPGARAQMNAFGADHEAAPEAKKVARERRAAGGYAAGLASIPSAPPPPEYSRDVIIQTGPGIPTWSWREIPLRWSGPVEHAQRLHLLLMPPGLNLFLAFVRVALISALVALMLRAAGRPGPRLPGRASATAAAFLALLLGGGLARADEQPTDERLNELKERLLEKPKCAPGCASITKMALDAQPERLTIHVEVSAGALVGVPMPGGGGTWAAQEVLLDGRPATLTRAGNQLGVLVPEGVHQLVISGRLGQQESISLPLPLQPHWVTFHGAGWTVSGVDEDGVPEGSLQLTRNTPSQPGADKERGPGGSEQSGVYPPFVQIQRRIALGLSWGVTTTVHRLSPLGSPVVLEVPLIRGESVTTPGIRVARGKALINMGPEAAEVAWQSVLDQRPALERHVPLTMEAQPGPWSEVWVLEQGPLWHVQLSGIPQVHPSGAGALREPTWQPFPKESVTLTIERPPGVPGPSLSIDSSHVALSPGLRATDATLDLSIRSSRAGQHLITLPEGAVVQSVLVQGQSQPIRQEGRTLTLPIAPGPQRFQVAWREPRGLSAMFRAPVVDLGAPSVNARTELNLPADRWVLLVGGPRLGPAVLFWGVLVVIVLIALVLGKSRMTPLDPGAWALLALGLSQVPLALAAVPVAWFFALGARKERAARLSGWALNAVQVVLAGLTLVSLGVLLGALHEGLMGTPDMQVEGNGSSAFLLKWFLDRSASTLPRPWVLSAPMLVYRMAMLAWALWLARSSLRWVVWAWDAFTAGSVWWRQPTVLQAQPAPTPAAGHEPKP